MRPEQDADGLLALDYLLVSPAEMATLAEASGWRLARVVAEEGPLYVGVLEKG